jgi:hypothetical protein
MTVKVPPTPHIAEMNKINTRVHAEKYQILRMENRIETERKDCREK